MSTEQVLDGLMADFLGAVTFPVGGEPSYWRIRELFIPGGLLIKNSGETPEVAGVEDFIAPRQHLFDSGALTAFAEFELTAIRERFGNVAHRMSTYGKRGTQDGVAFAATGVISTQFVLTPDGWRMSAMAWDDERPGLAIPERYAAGSTKTGPA